MIQIEFVDGSRSELLFDLLPPDMPPIDDQTRAPELLFSVLQTAPFGQAMQRSASGDAA